MGNCKYCGRSAGIFRDKHAECEIQHKQRERVIEEGRRWITSEVSRAIHGNHEFSNLATAIAEIEKTHSLPTTEKRKLLASGWESAVTKFLEDGIIDAKEEARLLHFTQFFNLSKDDLDSSGAFTRVTKAVVLREILNGELPQRMTINGHVPINLQKGEQIVWAFPGSRYLEDKVRRQFVGGSHGMSVRVMKGVYCRVGAFKGHAVEHTERVHIDTGLVIATNKNLYFAGPRKSVRVPYAKIVSFEPFEDGIGIMRDAATAKLQVFATGDGWFTYNLVTNLCQM